MDITTLMKMPDEDFDKYESATATVPLPMLEKLIDAVHMLSEGARLNTQQREIWKKFLVEAHEIYDPKVKEIVQE